MRRVVLILASVGGLGYFPVASGTVGTLAAIPLFFWTAEVQQSSPVLTVVTFVLCTLLGCWIAGRAEEELHEHDSHAIVLDEVLGYLAATLFLAPTWQAAIIAFFIFRLFDIIKPFPAGLIDARGPGGYGVVLDDVVSGIYANLATRVVLLLF